MAPPTLLTNLKNPTITALECREVATVHSIQSKNGRNLPAILAFKIYIM